MKMVIIGMHCSRNKIQREAKKAVEQCILIETKICFVFL